MATKKPQLKSYIEQEIYDKIKVIAKKEKRSMSNLIEIMLENEIKEYERQNGNISMGDINISGGTNNIDIG